MKRPNYHIVEFSETGYGLQHPESCLPNLLDCPHDKYLRENEEPDKEPGRYGFKLIEAQEWLGEGWTAASYWELTE